MACESWREDIETYVDGELSPERRQEFESHMRTCASCAADAAGRLQFKGAIQRAGRRFTPSAELRRRVEEQISPPARKWRIAWIPAAAMAGLAAILLLAAVWVTNRETASTVTAMSEVVDLHIAALASANPVDVVSTDEHTVKPWFEGKLPFEVNLPDFAGTPFTLIGGRVAYLDQTPGAALLVQFKKHRMSVFIFRERAEWNGLDTNSKLLREASMSIDSWSASELRYFIVSGTGEEAIRQLEGLFQKVAQPQ
ncbi:MAG TPA: zf-HC2 domain-containing protein [Candidatus Acidoferrales bacterium]|nr:zf-HC2 domain-containing protein [Candidatus Acidoferrales bacterium]